MSEQEAVVVLCIHMGVIDKGANEEAEIIINVGMLQVWPFFTGIGGSPTQILDKVGDLIEQNKNDIAHLVDSAFAAVTKRNWSLAYAAMIETAYADSRLAQQEIELLDVAEARFNISSGIKSALMTSARIRFGT